MYMYVQLMHMFACINIYLLTFLTKFVMKYFRIGVAIDKASIL